MTPLQQKSIDLYNRRIKPLQCSDAIKLVPSGADSIELYGFKYDDGRTTFPSSITDAGLYLFTLNKGKYSNDPRIQKHAAKGGFVKTTMPFHHTNLRLFETKQKAEEYLNYKYEELQIVIEESHETSLKNLKLLKETVLP